MAYTTIPSASSLTTLTGLTEKQVVFGAAGGTGTSAADLTYDNATNDFTVTAAESGGTVGIALSNTSNAASSAARHLIEVGGASAADPYLRLSVSGVTTWDLALANATSDEFQITANGTTTVARVNTSGEWGYGGAPIAGRRASWHGTGHLFLESKTTSGAHISNLTFSAAARALTVEVRGDSAAGTAFGETAASLAAIYTTNCLLTAFVSAAFSWVLGSTRALAIDSSYNVVCGSAALATTATNGFFYLAACAGTPTGAPTAVTGRVPVVVDSTNNKLYFYTNGAWRDAGP